MASISNNLREFTRTHDNQSHIQNVVLPDGSVSQPSLSFDNDPTTGFYSQSAGTIQIATSGSKRMDISDNTFEIIPAVDNTEAFKVSQADGSAVFTVDTTNLSLGLANTAGSTRINMNLNNATYPSLEQIGSTSSELQITSIGAISLIQDSNNTSGVKYIRFGKDGTENSFTTQLSIEETSTIHYQDNNPSADTTYDLGTASLRWDNTYSNKTITTSNEIGDGTASAPSLYFTSDTDTGLYRVATDEIGIATNGIKSLCVKPDLVVLFSAVGSQELSLDTTNNVYPKVRSSGSSSDVFEVASLGSISIIQDSNNNDSGKFIRFAKNGWEGAETIQMQINESDTTHYQDNLPNADGTLDLGSASLRWANVHSDSLEVGAITTISGGDIRGSYTPTITDGNSHFTATPTINFAEYVRIGNLVTLHLDLQAQFVASTIPTGAIKLHFTLPFNQSTNAPLMAGSCHFYKGSFDNEQGIIVNTTSSNNTQFSALWAPNLSDATWASQVVFFRISHTYTAA